jgi:hypothetical protein
MKRIILILVAACCAPALPAAPAQGTADTPANRTAAAKRYLKVVPAAEMVAETLERLAASVPEDMRDEYKKTLAKVIKSERIEAMTLEALTKHFTVREINALAAFYGSPEGRSISKKFGDYMTDLLPAIQDELGKAMDEVHLGLH